MTPHIFLAALFLFHLELCFSFTQTGYYILDLETDVLTTEVTDWSLSTTMASNKIYTTSAWNSMPSRALLGGPDILGTSGVSAANQFFSRSYSGISPHKYVSFTLILWYFDDWTTRNYLPSVKFTLDSQTVTGTSLLYLNDFTSSEGGNSTEKDLGFNHIMAGTPHTGSTMLFKIIHLLTDAVDTRRFGFREISFTFSNYSGPTPSICQRSEEIASLTYSQCSCPLGQALSGISCVSCALGCKTCFGPFASQCFQCNSGLVWTGAQCCDPKCSVCSGVTSDECSECYSPNFNYKNGTCKDTCPSPFQSTTQGTQALCLKPCQPGEYYYSFNQTCLTKCPSPLSNYTDPSDNILYCLNPCNATTQYLFTNGTCLDSCPSLLANRQEPGVQYCFNPCPSPSTYFIFTTNGTCLTSCPFPLSIYQDPGVKYCFNPCSTGQYLFQNGSCFNTCPTPFSSRIEPGGVQYCFNPCTSPATDYLYPNGTCSTQCLSPLISRTEPNVTYCFNPCSSYDLYLYTNNSCLTTCPSPLAIKTESVAKFCFNPCPDPSNQYLFQNQSCFTTCPFPLASRIEPDAKYCFNPCLPNQYLFANQSCFDTCPSPLVSRTEPNVKYCFNPCTSPTTQYLYPNGTCSTQCAFPLANRSEPDVMYCFNPCSSLTFFLYANQSCFSTCPSPLASRTEPIARYCYNPCPSPTNDFLFSNQSCFSTCPYPLQSRQEPGVKYCYNPCSTTSFLFWNQTCSPTCPSPLVYKLEPGVNYCINPCPSPTTELLYRNGSCLTTCPSPLFQRSEPGVKYCYNPCQYPGSYLYTNGTCSNYCPTPLISRYEPDVDYCFPPCSTPHIYWYINTTCLPTCDFPYVKVYWSGVQECISPCKNQSNYYYKYEKNCQVTCDPPFFQYYRVDQIKVCFSEFNTDYKTVMKYRSSAASLDSQIKASSALAKTIAMLKSSHPSSALLFSYSSMFQYIRYLDIQYPTDVQILFAYSSPHPITLNFNFSAPRSLQNHTLPDTFDKYKIHSDFLYNIWNLLGTLLVSFLVILALKITLKGSKKFPQAKPYLLKLLSSVKWNIPVMLLYSTSGDILFFAALHFNAMKINGIIAFISLLIALIMVLAVLWLFYLTIRPVLALRKTRKNASEYLAHFWKDYRFLYIFFEEKSLLKLSYMSVFLIRGLIFSLTISCLYNSPMFQVSIITLSNALMIGFLLFSRPFKNILNFLQALINELLLIVLSICILILAAMDNQKTDNQTMRVNLGNVIIFILKAFNATAIAFLGLYILLGIRFLYKKYKYLDAKGVSGSMWEAMIFEEFNPKKRVNQNLLEPGKKQKIFKPLRNNQRDSSQGHLPLRHFVAETSSNNGKSSANLHNMSSQSMIRLNNALELSPLREEEEYENIEAVSLNNQSSTKLDKTFEIELDKSPGDPREKSALFEEDLRLSLDSDQASKNSENLIQIFKKLRNKKSYKKSSIKSHHLSMEKSDSEKSIFQEEKPKIFKEEETSMLKLALPEDSDSAAPSSRSVLSDFRSFRNKQNRTRERLDKKNWYDGVRKGQLGKDESQEDL